MSRKTPARKPMQTIPTAMRVEGEERVRRRNHEKKTVIGSTRPRAICCERGEAQSAAAVEALHSFMMSVDGLRRTRRQRIAAKEEGEGFGVSCGCEGSGCANTARATYEAVSVEGQAKNVARD